MRTPSQAALVQSIEPPRIEARPRISVAHGEMLTDDYGWLRAPNWRDVLRDPAELPGDIRAVLERENAYADETMRATASLQKQLAREMRGRIEEEDAEVPVPDGPFQYYGRYREGGQHELICRQPRGGSEEAVLLDGDLLASGTAFFDLAATQHAPNHALIAWGADDKGSELYTLRVRDVVAGTDLPDLVSHTDGEVVWTADSRAFFYVKVDENHRASSVYLHDLGTAQDTDLLILKEADPAWFVSIGRTRSARFLVIDIHGHDAAESHVADLDTPRSPPRLIAPRRSGLRYEVDHRGDRFIILTNADGAEDFKIVETPVQTPGPDRWRDVVPHRPGCMIVSIAAFQDHLVRLERENGLPRIVIRAVATGNEKAVAFPEQAYSLGLEEVLEQNTAVMRFSYSSMTTPEEIYDYDMGTERRTLRKRQKIPSGHDPSAYVTRRIFATAPDGAQVPISVLHRRDLQLDGSAPLLLYGYGAYGHALAAAFGTKRLSLVDRGFVYAIAHVRGGTDKGWHWYEDGKLAHKRNTFGDFAAAGRALVDAGFTRPGRIVAHGGSAGGMLMGVVAASSRMCLSSMC